MNQIEKFVQQTFPQGDPKPAVEKDTNDVSEADANQLQKAAWNDVRQDKSM